ncbi:Dephospho-CoA kinase [bioreactor metagenome]|uniref:Dephospho-CoA kinase n=1 Tax=bioreactor metagenome TaxID=1076179 RepID=A0A645HXR2_9ZZZZ
MKTIGITGPTGAGKTTALAALQRLGALVIDADAVYHRLTRQSARLRQLLETGFGPVYDSEGNLDRKRLGEVVFQDQQALAELNRITHAVVGEEIWRLLDQAELEGRQCAAIDAIALIESGLSVFCDAVVGVVAPAEVRIERIKKREGISEEYARLRVSAQKGEDYYRQHCSYILENTGEDAPECFSARAEALFHRILSAT